LDYHLELKYKTARYYSCIGPCIGRLHIPTTIKHCCL